MPKAIEDPLLQREVQLQRVRCAVQATSDQEDIPGALRTILIGAEALKTDAAIRELVIANPDLAAAFMLGSASKIILQDSKQIEHHGPLLFHRLRENAASKNGVMAREDFRQLRAWLERRQEELEQWKAEHPNWHPQASWTINYRDVAAEIEATLFLLGPKAALADLRRWRPRALHLEIARILIPRLLMSGNTNFIEECLTQNLVPAPWDLLLLVPLALSGRPVDIFRLENSIAGFRPYARLFKVDRLRDERTASPSSYWLDTIITACEIVIAHGGSWEPLLPLLEALAGPQFRQIERLFSWQASLLDLLLRAHALLEQSAGRSITVNSFFSESDTTNATDNPTRTAAETSDRKREEELRRTVSSLVGIYRVRAEIIAGKTSPQSLDESLTRGIGVSLYEIWRYRGGIGARDLRKRVALSVASLLCVPTCEPAVVLDRSLDVFEEHLDAYGSDELAAFAVLALNSNLHQKVLALIVDRAKSLSTMKTTASEKIAAMLDLVRFLDPISRPDAKELFGEAHSMTEQLDSEAIFQLKCLAALSVRAKDAMSVGDRRNAARDLVSIVTDAAMRLSGQKGFPWQEMATGLTILSGPVAFAAIARWEDTSVDDWDSCLCAALNSAVTEQTMTAEEATALFPLIENPPEELFASVANTLDVEHKETSPAVLDSLAKDELFRLDGDPREEVLCALNISRLASDDAGPWVNHLRMTCDFLAQLDKRTSDRQSEYHLSELSPEATRQVIASSPRQPVTPEGLEAIS